MNTLITESKIEQFIKHTIRDVIKAEFMKFYAVFLPSVSLAEQLDIEKRYGKKPSRKSVKSFSFKI